MKYSKSILTLLVLSNFLNLVFGYQLSTSLWLDETITAWIISSSLSDVWIRSIDFQAQSPLYYYFMYLLQQIFGLSEIVLRLPSLIAGILSLVLITKFNSHQLRSPTSLVIIMLLMSHGDFISALFAARPYMLAFLSSLLTCYFTLRWLEKDQPPILALAIVSFITTFYLHYLFIFPLSALVLLLAWDKKIIFFHKKYQYVAILFGVGFAFIPGFLHLRLISARADSYSFAPPLSLTSVGKAFFAFEPSLLLLISLALVCICLPQASRQFSFNRCPTIRVPFIWFTVPAVVLILLSLLSGHSLIVGRYYLLGAPGVALLGGWLTERFTRDQARFCVALLIGIFMLILPRVWVREEWREAVASVDNGVGNDCILLLNSGLIEGEHIEWLRDRKNAEYLTAPLRVYPSTCRVMVVPKIYDSSYSSFVETAVLPDIALYKKIYIFSLLSRSETNAHDLPMTIQSYNDFFADRKITYISEQRFGSVVVAQYQHIL